MKSINNSINEALQTQYRVAFLGATDDDNIPFTVTISVDKANVRDFENFLDKEQDNIFAHAEGGQIEY